MIITLAIYIISGLIGVIALILPVLQVFPDQVYEFIEVFVTRLLELNTFFLIIPDMLIAVLLFLKFLTYFFIYKITAKILNYFRGAGQGL